MTIATHRPWLSRLVASNAWLAALAGGFAFAVYLRTLLTDLGGYEDTPKFQYLGAVLGTAHAPGYPLHTLLSWLFSLIPIGNYAYRANLLSAASGAATVGLLVLVTRAMACSRPASLCAALTLAFGASFWAFSVLAEVYALAALLALAVLYWLIRWHQSTNRAHLYAASACFALALGNHVTVVMAAPAIALFVWASPARRTLTVRTALTAGAVAAAGFLQYAYLVVRTYQNAAWVEARVRSMGDFVSLFQRERYESFLVPFTWDSLWSIVLPAIGDQARLEFGLAGLAIAGLGGIALTRREWRVSALVGLSAAATMWLMAHFLGYRQGFLVPAWAMVAIYLAVGADALHRAASRLAGRAWMPIAAAVLVLYPLVPLVHNFRANDWSRRTDDASFLRAVLRGLPSPAALVGEGYVVDSMLQYLEALEGGGPWRRIQRTAPDAAIVRRLFEEGVPVFAFDDGYRQLAAQGFDFQPVDVPGPTLADRLRELPRDAIVAMASKEAPLPVDVAYAVRVHVPAHQLRPRPRQAFIAHADARSPEFAADVEEASVSVVVGGSDGQPRRTLVASSGADAAIVPAVLLRTGGNLIVVHSSSVVRPSDDGSADDRRLGIGLRQVVAVADSST